MVNLDLPILNRVKNILTKTEKIDTDVTSVLTKLAEQGVDIDSIITSIGKSGDQASTATIFGKLAGLASQSGGAVKSVQRGTVTFSGFEDRTINISTVNPSKTIVLIRSENDAGSVGGYGGQVWSYPNFSSVLKSLSSKSFTISGSVSYTCGRSSSSAKKNFGVVSWQVIEFK